MSVAISDTSLLRFWSAPYKSWTRLMDSHGFVHDSKFIFRYRHLPPWPVHDLGSLIHVIQPHNPITASCRSWKQNGQASAIPGASVILSTVRTATSPFCRQCEILYVRNPSLPSLLNGAEQVNTGFTAASVSLLLECSELRLCSALKCYRPCRIWKPAAIPPFCIWAQKRGVLLALKGKENASFYRIVFHFNPTCLANRPLQKKMADSKDNMIDGTFSRYYGALVETEKGGKGSHQDKLEVLMMRYLGEGVKSGSVYLPL